MRRKLLSALSGASLGAFFSGLLLLLGGLFRAEPGPESAAWWGAVFLPGFFASGLVCGFLTYYFLSPHRAVLPSVPLVPGQKKQNSPAAAPTNGFKGKGNKEKNGAGRANRRRRFRHGMIGRLNPSLGWVHASFALGQFLNRPVKDLRKETFLNTVHPADVAGVQEAFEGARTKKPAAPISFRIFSHLKTPRKDASLSSNGKTPSGGIGKPAALKTQRPHYVRMEIRGRFNRRGVFRCFDLHLVDITELVRAELALRKRSQELSLANEQLRKSNQDLDRLKESYWDLYHNAPVMFFSLDPQGRLVTFNDTFLRRLGYRREELLNAPYLTLLAPQAAAEWQAGTIAGKSPAHALSRDREVETRWRVKNGATLDVWVRSVPVLDEAGRFVRSRSAALDLSERNRLANELRFRGDELEGANARLRHINAELEDFTHVVSHDLKEPLRTLQAFSNILAQDFSTQLGPDGFECINHLNQASRRLGALIDDLLQLSQAGRSAGKPQVFNLIEAVAVVRRDLIDLVQRKEATLLAEGSLPTISGDHKRITQLLANLVANGLKYNKNPVPQVLIGTAANPPLPPGVDHLEPNQVAIFVRDNGIGIDPQYHQQIFGIFRRLLPDDFEGTGAGLAICKKIVQAHGGHLWVDSQLGQGATFYFTLPRAPLDNGKTKPSTLPEVPATLGPMTHPPPHRIPAVPILSPEGARANLLLVEDWEDVAVIVRRLAHRSGLNVTWFPNAEEAWEHLKDHEHDLLLLDINLPGMTGLELCRKVRRELGRNSVPIVLFTGNQKEQTEEKMRDAGASHLLSKDLLCQPHEWERRIREILQGAEVGR